MLCCEDTNKQAKKPKKIRKYPQKIVTLSGLLATGTHSDCLCNIEPFSHTHN